MHRGLVAGITLSLLLPLIAIRATAQGGAIELAVDTANFNQDGLLVLFGGLRMQGDIGLPVAAGDINGDGRADVVFCGMYGSVFPRQNNGVVNFYISDGRDSGAVDAQQNPPNIFKLFGRRSGDLLGTSVSANSDVNGDGIRDVAIGAALFDGPNNDRFNAGAAYVVFGSQNFNLNADISTVDGLPPPGIIAIYGPQVDGRMGIWIDEGDLDGDGFADIIVGSDQINSDAGQHVGGAYIVFGSANLPSVIDLSAPPAGVRTARIVGSHQEDHWGAALQVGDINNDGIGDLIIGGSINRDSGSYVTPQDQDNGHAARAADFGGQRTQCGEAYVIYGQRNWPSTIDLRTPPAGSTHVIGAHEFDYLGSQVHSGDVNGDGRTDLIIGALRATAPDNQGPTGAVYVIYGDPNLPGAVIDLANNTSGLRVTSIYGEHALDCAGDSVRTYDINKDGMSDLFIGSPERTFTMPNGEEREDAGVTEIIYGQRDFLPPVIKLYDPPASPRIFRLAGAHGEAQGLSGGDEFSYRLSGGDVDGDGYIDYVANAMHGDGTGGVLNGGNVYIFSGKKLSAKLGMLPPVQTQAPVLTGATLMAGLTGVAQAPAGQNNLSVSVFGNNLQAGLQIFINDIPVISSVPFDAPPGSLPTWVFLDQNPLVKNSTGPLVVRVRNTLPTPSDLSNAVTAGRLTGPEITSIKVKKKASGLLILKINGANFASDSLVSVRANGSAVPVQSASFDPPDYVQVKINAANAPIAGTVLMIRVVTAQGIQSNEAVATAK